jgi:bacillolysin
VQNRFRWFSVVAIFSILLSSGLATVQAAPPTQTSVDQTVLQRLADATSGQARVSRHSGTGKVRFIGTSNTKPVARPAGVPASAGSEVVARAYLASYGSLFGLKDQASELVAAKNKALRDGRSSVRFTQRYAGLPVIAGDLVVNLNQNKELLSITGEVLPESALATTAAIAPADAQATARALVAKHYATPAAGLTVSSPTLSVFNPVLLGGPGIQRTSLVWKLEVTGDSAAAIRQYILVDAQTGAVSLSFNQIAHAKERHVCDDNNVVDTDQNENNDCTPAKYVRNEGDPVSAVDDINDAYDYSGATYDFYNTFFGRDSINDSGMVLRSLVRYCPLGDTCPYGNAFWNGQQMTYGDGFATAEDVVAHELSHGVTEYSSNLLYYYQSGALNEALSDIFGELMDLTYAGKNADTAADRWILGEELGGIRNMKNPPSKGDPDRMESPLYTLDPSQADNGGVHTNSGVANKSLYLMTDGDTFNGFTITGLGITKTAQIYYEVETNGLTSGSDYQDFGDLLRQACATLTGQFGITAADCVEVNKVVLATEMDQTPANAPAPDVEMCRPGQSKTVIMTDSFEAPSANWASGTISGAVNTWRNPGLEPYATDGIKNVQATGGNAVENSFFGTTVGFPVIPGMFVHVRHAYDFEAAGSDRYDGGVIEYSTNNGVSWSDAAPFVTANGYNGVIGSDTNPLNGRAAFTGVSNGYTSTRFNLGGLVGQTVKIRFRLGTDNGGAAKGWYIDEPTIYTCGGTGQRSAPYATVLGGITLEQGSGPVTATVATVSDAEQVADSLAIAASGAPAGLDISLDNTNGMVRAAVECACSVPVGTYPITLTVTNNDNLTGAKVFLVEVTPAGQVVEDPSFEVGAPIWEVTSTTWTGLDIPICSTSACSGVPRTGSGWARFGSRVNLVDDSAITQTLNLPAGNATLEFYLNIYAHSGGGTSDYLRVLFDGVEVFRATDADTAYNGGYVRVTLPLANLTAGEHVLSLRSHNTARPSIVRFSVDDLTVIAADNICTAVEEAFKVYLPIIRR